MQYKESYTCHTTVPTPHRLSMSDNTRFKLLIFTYRTVNSAAPSYLSNQIQNQKAFHTLHSIMNVVWSLNHTEKHVKQFFSSVVPQWWNELLHSALSRMLTSYGLIQILISSLVFFPGKMHFFKLTTHHPFSLLLSSSQIHCFHLCWLLFAKFVKTSHLQHKNLALFSSWGLPSVWILTIAGWMKTINLSSATSHHNL